MSDLGLLLGGSAELLGRASRPCRRCRLSIGIVALGKRPNGRRRDNRAHMRERRGARDLRVIRVTVAVEVHATQCTVQSP